jgi:endonuclease YncB( thermonuclease family)
MKPHHIPILLLALCAAFCIAQDEEPAKPDREFREVPQLGIALPCKVLSVHDGDTLKVECKITMDIRLLDCWAPELSGENRLAGFKSRDNLRALAEGKTGIVSIPLNSDNIGKATSMSRVLGRVLINGDDVGYLQVKGGFAKKAKDD